MKDDKAPAGQESEREELGLSAAMVGLGQVTSAADGSVESTLVMESLGKEQDLDKRVVHQGLTVYGNKGCNPVCKHPMY